MSKVEQPKQNGGRYVEFLSGFISGTLTSIVCAPLDITRTRLNLAKTSVNKQQGFLNMMKQIYTKYGYKGYYDGISATLLGVPVFQFLFFGIYYNMKPWVNENFKWLGGQKFSCDVIASLLSGSFCQILTNPLWVVRVRMQADLQHKKVEERRYSKLIKSFQIILKEEGIRGFYKGTIASQTGVSHVMVNMPVYDHILRYIKKQRNKENLGHIDIVIASNIAKAIACILTYPHIVIRSRQQDFQEYSHQLEYYKTRAISNRLTIREVIYHTYRNEGFKGFYGGLGADLVKVLPTNTILMLTFEYCRQKLGHNYH